jgi:hypothetical protein
LGKILFTALLLGHNGIRRGHRLRASFNGEKPVDILDGCALAYIKLMSFHSPFSSALLCHNLHNSWSVFFLSLLQPILIIYKKIKPPFKPICTSSKTLAYLLFIEKNYLPRMGFEPATSAPRKKREGRRTTNWTT